MEPSICLHACLHEFQCVYNYMCLIMYSPSYLPDGSLCVYLPLILICITRYWDVVFTVRAGFVNKVAEVEQGSPGSQILDEPLRKKPQ